MAPEQRCTSSPVAIAELHIDAWDAGGVRTGPNHRGPVPLLQLFVAAHVVPVVVRCSMEGSLGIDSLPHAGQHPAQRP